MYDIETDEWKKSGILPNFHIVTEQITVLHNEVQTFTVFTQVDFNANKFEICMATNNGNTDETYEWTWLMKRTVDIQNFHIKSAVMLNNKLIITARGRPRDTFEQCCSFLLILDAIQENKSSVGSLITGFEEEYHFIKLDPVIYPQLNTTPTLRVGLGTQGFASLTVVQENNFQEAFPRQLLRFIIPSEDLLSKDSNFIETENQQIIDMEF